MEFLRSTTPVSTFTPAPLLRRSSLSSITQSQPATTEATWEPSCELANFSTTRPRTAPGPPDLSTSVSRRAPLNTAPSAPQVPVLLFGDSTRVNRYTPEAKQNVLPSGAASNAPGKSEPGATATPTQAWTETTPGCL